MKESEIAAGDPRDRGNRLSVGEVEIIEREAELTPVPRQRSGRVVLDLPHSRSRRPEARHLAPKKPRHLSLKVTADIADFSCESDRGHERHTPHRLIRRDHRCH
jgi:hypothetical protein